MKTSTILAILSLSLLSSASFASSDCSDMAAKAVAALNELNKTTDETLKKPEAKSHTETVTTWKVVATSDPMTTVLYEVDTNFQCAVLRIEFMGGNGGW